MIESTSSSDKPALSGHQNLIEVLKFVASCCGLVGVVIFFVIFASIFGYPEELPLAATVANDYSIVSVRTYLANDGFAVFRSRKQIFGLWMANQRILECPGDQLLKLRPEEHFVKCESIHNGRLKVYPIRW